MTTFVDLLRAVNVSGQNRLPMAELRVALAEAGLSGVETYVQSGNIVSADPGDEAATHAALVHDTIARRFGLDVAVLTLTAEELREVAAGNPYLGEVADVDRKWLHVTFFAEAVEAAAFAASALPATGDEAAVIAADGRLAYLRLPYGYGRTKLNNAWFERALRVRATTRNWRTVVALTELAGAGKGQRSALPRAGSA